ncbi:uncharacterized protein LOC126659778 [Mercurialis annua]|uniref:uncharacterized protein LOC126659778 n=1 Tax=Mercurialis annua TaxID=3986 RepID=UPI0021606C3E|nr:uncharacterized protein LOC126659778 [Mercurialis annua]
MQTLQKPININVNVNVDDEEPRTTFVSEFSSCNNNNDEIVKESRSDDEVDLESGVSGDEIKMHALKDEKDCRICHMSLDVANQESGANGLPIELGCCCKDDLAVAHKHCAEAWFKIKGNKTCEICGSVARNVTGPNEVELVEQWNEGNEAAVATAAPSVHAIETRHFWQGHRFLNFLLACMVFAFVISWLFHFNVPS